MTARPESMIGRLARAARSDKPVLRITVAPQLARFLVAAGARPAPSKDIMTVEFPSGNESARPGGESAVSREVPGTRQVPGNPARDVTSDQPGPPSGFAARSGTGRSGLCPHCGAELFPGDVFCGVCGFPVDAPSRAGSAEILASRSDDILSPLESREGLPGGGSFFSHEPPRPRRLLSDTERYLAGAAYADPKYAALVIREFLASRRAVVPAGVDLESIVMHCLKSRQLRFTRDILLSAVLIVSLFLAPVPTIALMASMAFLGILRAFRRNRAPMGVRVLLAFGGAIALAIAVAAWAAVGAGILFYGLRLPGTLVPDGIAIAFVLCLCAVIAVGYAAVRNRILAEYLAPGARPPSPAFVRLGGSARARLDEAAGACYGNLMLSDDPESALGLAVGSQAQARPLRSWSLVTRLTTVDRKGLRPGGGWVPIDPVELHQSIRQRLLGLSDPGLPVNERISALKATDLIIGEPRIPASSPLFDRDRQIPYSQVSDEAAQTLIRHPQAGLRCYQWVRIKGEGPPVFDGGRLVIDGYDGGAEFSALIRVGVEGRMLFLEFVPGVLPSVKEEYQAADRITRNRILWKDVRDAASNPLLDVVLAPARVLSTSWSMTTKASHPRERKTLPDTADIGARFSVRVLGAAQALTGRQLLDASKYNQMIERQVLAAVSDFLVAKGVDLAEFEAGARVVLGNSTFIPDVRTTSPESAVHSVTRVSSQK